MLLSIWLLCFFVVRLYCPFVIDFLFYIYLDNIYLYECNIIVVSISLDPVKPIIKYKTVLCYSFRCKSLYFRRFFYRAPRESLRFIIIILETILTLRYIVAWQQYRKLIKC